MVNRAERVTSSRHIHTPPHHHRRPHAPEDYQSTISKSKTVVSSYTPSKPLLPSPMWDSINQVGRLERVADRFTLQKESQIDMTFDKIQKLHQEEALKLEEAYNISQDVSFWGILEDIGSSLMSSISFFFGFSAVAAGGTAVGAALIVSGVLSLSNIAFKHAQTWDWIADQVAGGDRQMHQAILTYLPPAIGITAAAMGAFGAWGAWHYSYLQGTEKALAILGTTTSLAKGISAYGSGRVNAQSRMTNAEISALQSKAELTILDLEEINDEIKEYQKNLSVMYEYAAKLIQDANKAVQLTQQPV
ncbi:MAG: hypothetical protein JSS30_08140 [Verrucomicrobia bacterium]|nr:hypothetical protein [Verrucomicrobiota bacterium]